MNSSFKSDDVTLLLKDITGAIEPTPTGERERKIQSGTHYSEMLPLEYCPSDDYIHIYEAFYIFKKEREMRSPLAAREEPLNYQARK